MKAMFWFGLILIVAGLASLFVPIPPHDRAGISAGNVYPGVTVQHDDKVSPIVTCVLLFGSASLLVTATQKS